MKKLFQITFFVLTVAAYCVYINRYQFFVIPSKPILDTDEKYYDYRGALNVHSNLSTGSGSQSEIIKAAQEQNLDFLVLTEVNKFENEHRLEGYFNQLLVSEGGEYSYLDSRLMYYNRPPKQPPDGTGQAQAYFADQLSQNPRSRDTGFYVLAHPFLSKYSWSGEYPVGLDGIEIINLKRVLEFAWEDKKIDSILSILTYPLNPSLSLLRVFKDPQKELDLWDALNKKKHTVGMMGTDATAKAVLFAGSYLRFPSYSTAFSVASNHVLLRSELTGDYISDKNKILNALQDGSFYIAIDILGTSKGFYAEVKQRQKSHPMGSKLKLLPGTKLFVNLPTTPHVPFEVRIIKDGQSLHTSNFKETTVNISEKGVYRIVVRVLVPMPLPEGNKWIPWIYSNAFYIED